VRSAEQNADGLTRDRDTLAGQVDDLARTRLRDDSEGRTLLAGLDKLSLAAGSTAVIGPGLTVTVSDRCRPRPFGRLQAAGGRQPAGDPRPRPATGGELAVGQRRRGGVRRWHPDRAERDHPAGGGAILVDNHPITSPYTILAIGPPNTMRDTFEHSPGLNRLRLLEASYGAGVTVSTGDGLTLPAGAGRDVEFARQAGS
jgi:uncharacterized protein YlxW (UPF0749 family)